MRACLGLLLAASLTGCALSNERQPVDHYDFGPPAQSASTTGEVVRLPGEMFVADVVAPAWMDSTAISYRLLFQNPARVEGYAHSRWLMPPAQLVSERIRATFASRGVALLPQPIIGARLLRVELEAFNQEFDGPSESRAVLRARATLQQEGKPLRQTVIGLQQSTLSPDARGGAMALAGLTDRMVEQLLAWVSHP
jgi:cholesterol transport system auxiliary component